VVWPLKRLGALSAEARESFHPRLAFCSPISTSLEAMAPHCGAPPSHWRQAMILDEALATTVADLVR
jgi:hypothetical protein